MRALSLGLVMFAVACGTQPSASSGGGGNGGAGGSTAGNSCLMPGASLDCARDCSSLSDICKNPTTKQCLDICIQVQSYCAQACKLASNDADFALFGCLQAGNGDCTAFSSCLDRCDGRNTSPVPNDLGPHD